VLHCRTGRRAWSSPCRQPWYVDLDRHQIGPCRWDGNPAVVARLFSLPPLSATAAALVGEALAEPARELPGDPEQASVSMRSIVAEPLAVLRLQTLNTHGNRSWREYLPALGAVLSTSPCRFFATPMSR
jgi:hypothetical protein